MSRPWYKVATFPHEFFRNAIDKLPVWLRRPEVHIDESGPKGSFFVGAGEEQSATLQYLSVIRAFELEFETRPGCALRLVDLVRRILDEHGVPLNAVVQPAESAVRQRAAEQAAFKSCKSQAQKAAKEAKAAARAAKAPSDDEAGGGGPDGSDAGGGGGAGSSGGAAEAAAAAAAGGGRARGGGGLGGSAGRTSRSARTPPPSPPLPPREGQRR